MIFRDNRHLGIVAVLVSFLVSSTQAVAEESRIWADKSGKFEIRAKFIDVKEGKVRLERPNGDITRIPLGKLSEEDQAYVQAANQPKPAKPPKPPKNLGLAVGDRVEVKHFGKWQVGTVIEIDYDFENVDVQLKGKSQIARMKSVDNLRLPGTSKQPQLVQPADPVLEGVEVVRPDTSDVARLLPDGSGATKVQTDPRSEEVAAWKPRAVRLRGRTDFHERPVDFALTSSPRPIAIVLHEPPGFKDDGPPRVEIVDMRSRKVLANGPALPNTKRVLFSPNGKSVATIAKDRAANKSIGQVDFWKLDGKQIDHWISFSPYVMETWPNVDPEWVAWLDEEHLLTTNDEGRAILWQVEGAKAVYELMIDRGAQPTLSPGRKHLAVPTTDGVQIYAARSGDLLATVGSGNLRSAKLAFSPSGRQLAAVSSGFVDVIDVTTGEITRSFPCKGARSSSEVWWIDEKYLFASGGLLIHVPRRIIAWQFEAGNSLFKPFAGTQWLLVDNRSNNTQILSPFQLPPPEALEAVKNLNDEELLAVRPGESVSMEVRMY